MVEVKADMIEIIKHRIHVNGRAVAYRETPNKGGAFKPQGVIVHDTAGGMKAEGSIAWLCNPAAKASAHIVVGRDGTITQLAPLNIKTWHAGKSSWKGRPNVNGFAVGIEIVNPGLLRLDMKQLAYVNALKVRIPGEACVITKVQCDLGEYDVRRAKTAAHGDGYWLAYSAAQIATVTALCRAIRESYGVTFIGTHWEIAPKRKIDTNPLFPLAALRSRVFAAAAPVAAMSDAAMEEPEDESEGGRGDEPDAIVAEAAVDPVTAEPRPAVAVQGDPDLWNVQRRLEAMGYNPGGLDGKWGTNTAGAIAGFIGGRKLDIVAPTSMEMFREVQEELKAAIVKAEADGHKRQIVPERKFADAKTVEEAAPEIKPVKQGRLAAIWTAISGFFLMIFNAVVEYFRDAMEWVANFKDEVPTEIWFALVIGICVLLAVLANRGAKGIEGAFKTGDRL